MSARIAYVLKRYPRYSETFIVNEILAHEQAGVEIDIFALRHSNDSHYQDVISKVKAAVIHLPRLGTKLNEFWAAFRQASQCVDDLWENMSAAEIELDAYDIYQALVLVKYIKERKIDHIHAHFLTSATHVARLAAKISGISYSVTAHAKDIYHEDVDETKIQTYIDDCQSLITVSDYNKNYLESRYANSEKIHRVYNGLDLERFAYVAQGREKNSIISVGRFVEKKGFEILIEACALLKNKVDFSCYLVGAGDARDSYQNLINRLRLNDCVTILGPRPQNELIELIIRSSILVAPCVVGEDGNRDGLPTVLLEAMALGTPCISTDVTGIPELISHDKTGVLTKQGNVQDLAKNMEKLLLDNNMQSRISLQARNTIEERFNITPNAAQQRELILSGLEK